MDADPFLDLFRQKLEKANQWPLYNSCHEAYAVMLEEVDEVWEIVKQHQAARDPLKLMMELADVMACAYRFMQMISEQGVKK